MLSFFVVGFFLLYKMFLYLFQNLIYMITTTDFDNKHVFLTDLNLKQHNNTPVRCNHLIVIYSTSGSARIELNYTVYNVTPNTLLLLSPLDIVTIHEVSSDYNSHTIVIQ